MNRPVYRALWTNRVTEVPRASASLSDTTTGPQPVREMSREVVCIPHPREPTVLIVACVVCGEHEPACPVGCGQGALVLALTAPWVAQFVFNHHRWCSPEQEMQREWTCLSHAAKAPT